MKQFKIRASALGQIMTDGKAKGSMGKICQSYCEQWLKEQLYGRKKEFSNKYTQKGQIMEDNSLDFIADELGYGMLIKNQQLFENDYMTGTPDALPTDLVIDVKNSWDCFTFPLLEDELPNKDYWWQMQSYMILAKCNKSKVIYVLSDTPLHLIEKQARYTAHDTGREYDEVLAELTATMTYADIPNRYKIKVYDIPLDVDVEARIISRVEECRKYINKLTKGIK